jgi:hypothetical protein
LKKFQDKVVEHFDTRFDKCRTYDIFRTLKVEYRFIELPRFSAGAVPNREAKVAVIDRSTGKIRTSGS